MNAFAKELNNIILKRSLSNSKAAKQSGIDPSLLRRYRKGERIPRTRQMLDRIELGLLLNKEEKNVLELAYVSAKSPQKIFDRELVSIDKMMKDSFQNNQFSPFAPIQISTCTDGDFKPSPDKKMYAIRNLEDLEKYLCYLNEYLGENHEILYTISNIHENHISESDMKLYVLPSIKNAEHLFFMNATKRHNKESIFLSYAYHAGMVQNDSNHSFYVLETETNMSQCSFGGFLTKTAMIKFEKIENDYSGFLTFDSKIIKRAENVFNHCKRYSMYYGTDIHAVFQKLWEETE